MSAIFVSLAPIVTMVRTGHPALITFPPDRRERNENCAESFESASGPKMFLRLRASRVPSGNLYSAEQIPVNRRKGDQRAVTSSSVTRRGIDLGAGVLDGA